MDNVTCLIPFINEKNRPLAVLEIVTKIPQINQIVCIDGSEDEGTSGLIKQRYPEVSLIKQTGKKGKSEAIKLGLPITYNDIVLLLDADIVGLREDSIKKAILYFTNHKSVGMILLKRENTHFIEQLLRGNILVIGERVLWKSDLEKVFEEFNPKGYQLEIAINHYMMVHGKKTLFCGHRIYKPPKFKKMGFFKGIYKDIGMQFEILSLFGLTDWVKQYLYFGKEEAVIES